MVIEIRIFSLLCGEGTMHKPAEVLQTFRILIRMLVACVHTYVKTHQAVHFRLVHFMYVLKTYSINKGGM